ncbi:hypothetical protein AVEN_20152-1 [Araneus ventricosus]|uniref:Uncharacterized protein n=1 Tax=Araneus ventricosus TaxID=182803 RepID=A0A4Y2QCP1_ARAVE|nr:hypothetical protein AVEN_20152-1 [Araneus ventricosus]
MSVICERFGNQNWNSLGMDVKLQQPYRHECRSIYIFPTKLLKGLSVGLYNLLLKRIHGLYAWEERERNLLREELLALFVLEPVSERKVVASLEFSFLCLDIFNHCNENLLMVSLDSGNSSGLNSFSHAGKGETAPLGKIEKKVEENTRCHVLII